MMIVKCIEAYWLIEVYHKIALAEISKLRDFD